jgi:hypothetical protein
MSSAKSYQLRIPVRPLTKINGRRATWHSSGAQYGTGPLAINMTLLRSEEMTFARGSKTYRTLAISGFRAAKLLRDCPGLDSTVAFVIN